MVGNGVEGGDQHRGGIRSHMPACMGALVEARGQVRKGQGTGWLKTALQDHVEIMAAQPDARPCPRTHET